MNRKSYLPKRLKFFFFFKETDKNPGAEKSMTLIRNTLENLGKEAERSKGIVTQRIITWKRL